MDSQSFGRAIYSGLNFIAAEIFPLIFIFPCKNAYWALSLPSAKRTIFSSNIVNVASGLSNFPSLILPGAFFISIENTVGFLSSALFKTSKWKIELTYWQIFLPFAFKASPIYSNNLLLFKFADAPADFCESPLLLSFG